MKVICPDCRFELADHAPQGEAKYHCDDCGLLVITTRINNVTCINSYRSNNSLKWVDPCFD